MPGGNGFFPPVQYSPLWGLLAAGILLLIVLFYVLVPWFTRDRRPRSSAGTAWMPFAPEIDLRTKYNALIGEVEESHRRGELSARASHQKLSLLLRYFVYESSGLRAPQMTLTELRGTPAVPLAEAVEKLYPGAFSSRGHGSVHEAAETARRVVFSWS